MPIRVIATKTLGRSIGGKLPSKPSVIDGDGDGFLTGADGKDNIPAGELLKDSFLKALNSLKNGETMPAKLPVPESWFQNETSREQVAKNFPDFHMRWNERQKMYTPSTGSLGKDSSSYDQFADSELASRYLNRKYWHPAVVQSDSPIARIMRTWRSDFSESRGMSRALAGMDVAKNVDSDQFRKDVEVLRDALNNAPPLRQKTYRVARLTSDLGKGAEVGSELNFAAAAVTFSPNTAQGFEMDELTGINAPSKFMFEFPEDTRGLIFDDAGEKAAKRIYAENGDARPQEGIVAGKFRVAKIEEREVADPRNPNKKITRSVYVLEPTSTKSIGRPIGRGIKPSMFDGDGDGFITNPVTGEDDVPAPTAIVNTPIRTLSKGVDAFDERFRKKFKQEVPQGDGDCFVAGYKLLEKMIREEKDPEKRKRIRLVHGSPLGTGGDARGQRFPHSWVEVDNNPTDAEKEAMLATLSETDKASMKTLWERMPEMNITVYDHSNGREIEVPAAIYYGLGNIEKSENRYYDYQQALKVSNNFGHYGPWE